MIGCDTSVMPRGRVMSNKMWGGRFTASPGRHHGGDQRLHRFRPAPLPPGHRRHQGPCRHAGQARHHHGRRCRQDRSRSRHDPVRDRGRQVHLQAGAGRHPYERGEPARRADRAGGRAAAYRALAQRPGGDRFPALDPRPRSTRSTTRSRPIQRALAEKALAHAGDRDAGLYASADRAAGDLRPSPPRLCGDGGARPRPLRRCAQAAQRIARSARRRSPAPRSRSTAT